MSSNQNHGTIITKRLTFEELMQEARLHGYRLEQIPKKDKVLRIASKVIIKALTKSKHHLLPHSLEKKHDNLKGSLRGITGDASAIHGDVSEVYGNVSALRGRITGLSGDVSGLNGDCTGLHGCATGIAGDVTGLTGFIKDHCN